MNRFTISSYFLPAIFFIISCRDVSHNNNVFVSIKTSLGDIKVSLYNETPVHRNNFAHLVNSHFYDGISFHRVIKDFMIQAGDVSTKAIISNNENDTLKTYTLPAEFRNKLFHKKGSLAAARQSNEANPEMRSSGTQFYIVEGTRYTDGELDQVEQRINNNLKQARFIMLIKQLSDSNRIYGLNLTESEIQERASIRLFESMSWSGEYKISQDQRNIYKSIGGTPFLDGTYTVFGEVIEGLDVVDKIAHAETDKSDKPFTDIKILRMKIVNK